MKDTVFDPNDPRNTHLLRSSKQLKLLSYSHNIDYFRLHDSSFDQDQFSLDSDDSVTTFASHCGFDLLFIVL